MEIRGVGFIPILMFFWCVGWLSAEYTLTIIHGHAPPLMYISELGNYYPEKILFTIGFIGMSIATLGLATLQYNNILLHAEAFGPRQTLIQRILLAIASVSCAGTTVMAIFSTADYPMVHRVAAFFAFGFGCIYNLWQSILLYSVPGSRVISHIRTASCILALTCFTTFLGCRAAVYAHVCEGECETITEAIARIVEWSTLVLVLINILSYYQNLQSLSLTVSWKGCNIARREEIQDTGV